MKTTTTRTTTTKTGRTRRRRWLQGATTDDGRDTDNDKMTRTLKTYGDCDDDVDGRRSDDESCGGGNCDDDETRRKTSRTKNDACEKNLDDKYGTEQLLRQRYQM